MTGITYLLRLIRVIDKIHFDNVVFEAGYFIGLKGKRNVLILRKSGSKMPADLGGAHAWIF
jgi:predicted nucleotide-binding protein